MLSRGDRICSGSVEDEHARPSGGVHVDIVDSHPGACDDTQVPPRGKNFFRDLSLTSDYERVGVTYGFEKRWNIQAVDLDDSCCSCEAIAGGGMNGVADDDDRPGLRPVRLECTEAGGEGLVHGILPSAGDVVGDDIEEGIEVVGGRDHWIVKLVAGLPCLDQKAAHAGSGIVPRMTQAVLDRMTEAGAECNGGFQIREDDRAL